MTLNYSSKETWPTLMQPMSETEFRSFIEHSIAGYARDLERTYQYDITQAIECAASSVDELLPQGRDTAGHFLFNLYCDSGERVGVVWFEVRSQDSEPLTLFVCDLEIHSHFQRQGWAQRALVAIEKWALTRGIGRMELNVFANNEAALALYRAAAFMPCEITMGKNLG